MYSSGTIGDVEKRRQHREVSPDNTSEVAACVEAERAIGARALDLAMVQAEYRDIPLDQPRPVLTLDPTFEPICHDEKGGDSSVDVKLSDGRLVNAQLHSDGRVEVTLPDGTSFNIMTRSFGPVDGWPTIYCSGLPSSGMPDLPYQYVRDLHLSGLRLILWDRPGYGDSDRWKGHRVGDGAVLMQIIARAYRLAYFSVMGRSGGAPYAVGAGALCPEAVNVGAFGCRAPSQANIDRLSGAALNNESLLNIADEELLALEFASTSGQAIIDNPTAVLESIKPHLGPSDTRVVLEMSVRRYLSESHRNALKYGPVGRIDNILALRAHWCFGLRDLGDKLTYLVQGLADDQFTTTSHFDYLCEHIPNHVPIERLDMGHMGTMALELPVLRGLARDAYSKI